MTTVNRIRSDVETGAAALGSMILKRGQLQPGWAAWIPDDPATYHVGNNPQAREFQRSFARVDSFSGFSASHMCIMKMMNLFRSRLPRRYLEIGVNEGVSVFSITTGMRMNYLLTLSYRPEKPLFDELVLADIWGREYGGTGRGGSGHVQGLLESTGVRVAEGGLHFLDGDSKIVVPEYLGKRDPKAPKFDAVYVDGDHSFAGASADVENVLPYVGDMLFFDDMYHPAHVYKDRLLEFHRGLVERLKPEFYVFINRRFNGFAAFVRKSSFDAVVAQQGGI